jgi:hypothetical protein
MTVIDPIADMLTRIRNAVMAGHALVAMPSSKLKIEIAKIMKDEGFLESFELADTESPQKVLRLKIKYVGERRERQARTTYLHQEAGYPMGAVRHWRCHPVDSQGCDDRRACPTVGCGRRDPLQSLVEGRR